jgi:hypothetical protein
MNGSSAIQSRETRNNQITTYNSPPVPQYNLLTNMWG